MESKISKDLSGCFASDAGPIMAAVSALIRAGVVAGGSGRVISTVTDTKSRSLAVRRAWLKVKPRCNQRRPYVARVTCYGCAFASSIEGKRDSIPSGVSPPTHHSATRKSPPLSSPLHLSPRVFCAPLIRTADLPSRKSRSSAHIARVGETPGS